jgi:hypothetical protein
MKGARLELTIEQIAIRSVAFWSFGIIVYASFGAAGVSRPQGWQLFFTIIGSIISIGAIMIGCCGAGIIARRLYPNEGLITRLLVAAVLLAAIWISSIVAQIMRNVVYQMTGQAPKPIQWYRGQRRKSELRNKRVNPATPRRSRLTSAIHRRFSISRHSATPPQIRHLSEGWDLVRLGLRSR